MSAESPVQVAALRDVQPKRALAAILIASIPLALVYNAMLNRFIAGFTGGAFR